MIPGDSTNDLGPSAPSLSDLPPSAPMAPVLLFDGDCGFCKAWVERWRVLMADQIEFIPYQERPLRFRVLSDEDLGRAVHLVESDGRVSRAAQAVFRAHVLSGRGRLVWWCYRRFSLVSGVSETVYRLVARHRHRLARPLRWLWGNDLRPATHHRPRRLFLGLLGAIFLVAFASLDVQVVGLIGEQGISPVSRSLDHASRQLGAKTWWIIPTFCWWNASDLFLKVHTRLGMVCAVLIMFNVAPRWALTLAWLLYLSLTTVGGPFLQFQWDVLLLETGLLAILLAPGGWWPRRRIERPPPPIAVWLIRWLLFRLMFLSGVVKLAGGDPVWRDLTALDYHYWTQPLPLWTSWYVQHWPAWFHQVSTVVMFAIELAVPFLIFAPRRLRALAGALFILFMVLIAVTGNYTFFNLLTMTLCIMLLDDHHWPRAGRSATDVGRTRSMTCRTPPRTRPGESDPTAPECDPDPRAVRRVGPSDTAVRIPGSPTSADSLPQPGRRGRSRGRIRFARRTALAGVAVILVALSLVAGWGRVNGYDRIPSWVVAAWSRIQPFHVANAYGLFADMTTRRPEIIVEGSRDGREWIPYEFRWKPGRLDRPPGWVQPHQPRLDWQMWFAALYGPRRSPWVASFMGRLLEGSPAVLDLLDENPFPDDPPRWVRATLYDYRFTDSQTRRETGHWWTRTLIGPHGPVLSRSRGR